MESARRTAWKGRPEGVKATYTEGPKRGRIQSRTRHVKPCLKERGPPRKAKYYLVTDSEQYREGKVKRTPGGE